MIILGAYGPEGARLGLGFVNPIQGISETSGSQTDWLELAR
jgi:hypothetical protein